MFSKLSKKLGGLDKTESEKGFAKTARSNSPDHFAAQTSSYAQTPPPEYDEENTLTPPDQTAGFSNLQLGLTSNHEFPTPDECIAHLQLLECFYRLRQKIGSTDGIFGIADSLVTGAARLPDDETAGLLAKLAEKRWALFVSQAVGRFEAWWRAIIVNPRMANISTLEVEGAAGELCEPKSTDPPVRFGKHNMPPADVLMVWHAYMLNPRAYLEDCLRYGKMQLWHTQLPWGSIVDCIDSETFAYHAGEPAKELFMKMTGMSWDNQPSTDHKQVTCPSCEKVNLVAWTTCPDFAPVDTGATLEISAASIDDMLSSGQGFCDKDFSTMCSSCNTRITHERMNANKFCSDITKLLNNNVPMGGTLLGLEGIPWKMGGETDRFTDKVTRAPNNLLLAGLGDRIAKASGSSEPGSNESMDSIRGMVEQAMKDRKYMQQVRASATHRLLRSEKIGIRRMMSRYWDNSTPFAIDLVGAVIRQGSFVEKMHNIDWLHSPALLSTTKRLLIKYSRFMRIMATSQRMAVPTLDVDLAWHTHQLSPYSYMNFTVKQTKQFVDHDDKIAETKLNDAFAWTSKTYQRLFSEPYSECTCWYCEAVRESHTSAVSRMFNSSATKATDMLHDVEQDPRKSVHISAHNAVRPIDSTKTYDAVSKHKADALEKQYEKACERARKKGRKEPRRDDYYYSDAWGYPVYIPAYSPYIGYVPYTSIYYPVAPGCMALGAGDVGNCCSGTCGGGVAAGACGGSASAGCGAGACSGGGGGGGGGCGGGGGGGGGCGGGGGGCGGGGGGCGGGGGG